MAFLPLKRDSCGPLASADEVGLKRRAERSFLPFSEQAPKGAHLRMMTKLYHKCADAFHDTKWAHFDACGFKAAYVNYTCTIYWVKSSAKWDV